MKGTTPAGAASELEAAQWVRGMFGRVAARYDLANHLLSCNIDRYWRAHTVRRLKSVWQNPDARVLDLCCGTADLLLALEKARPPNGSVVLGSDFCHPMLTRAARKIEDRRLLPRLVEADALQLPFAGSMLDGVAVAFGFRNLANYQKGLEEMRRILKPGGIAAILEFSQPPHPAFAWLYNLYSRRLLPLLGGAISGSRDAYAYLPESVRKFPSAEELARRMEEAGFREVEFERLTGGIVALHLGRV
ncbi:MAG: bifunctional demethylmenaquinone methyltransferase/2-methoxy-6-polyprenyl-1,4-benzoquinol methylase UbiE [Bryobacteraceae bacterium]